MQMSEIEAVVSFSSLQRRALTCRAPPTLGRRWPGIWTRNVAAKEFPGLMLRYHGWRKASCCLEWGTGLISRPTFPFPTTVFRLTWRTNGATFPKRRKKRSFGSECMQYTCTANPTPVFTNTFSVLLLLVVLKCVFSSLSYHGCSTSKHFYFPVHPQRSVK